MDISVEKISEGLGHNDTRTTQIYLDEFNDDFIDAASDLITS